MVDEIIAEDGTKMAQLSDSPPPHASRSFGLKSEYLSLHYCLIRESVKVKVKLLRMVCEPLYQFWGDSLWYKHVTANSKNFFMLSTIFDPATPADITDVLQDRGM